MTGIVDYGMGNLRSVQKAFEYLGERCAICSDTQALDCCSRLVLPGVGSFAAGMRCLQEKGFDDYLRRRAADTPLLGICLGMQFLLEESDEEGVHRGLGLISGRAERFTQGKIPHTGWNGVYGLRSPLFADIPDGAQFYFVHSYRATTAGQEAIATCEYHTEFAAAVNKGHVYGVQFHPEKSGERGLQLLANFLRIGT